MTKYTPEDNLTLKEALPIPLNLFITLPSTVTISRSHLLAVKIFNSVPVYLILEKYGSLFVSFTFVKTNGPASSLPLIAGAVSNAERGCSKNPSYHE